MDTLTFGLIALGVGTLVVISVLYLAIRKAWADTDALKIKLEDQTRQNNEAQLKFAEANADLKRFEELKLELDREREKRKSADTALAALQAQLDEREKAIGAERKRLTAMSQDMQDRFKALANDALDQSSKKFLEQAEKNFKHQNEQAHGGVKTLVEPLQKNLEQFRQQVEKLDKDQARNSGELVTQITKLSQGLNEQQRETSKLVNALQRKSTTRGQWGERTVENILELAGLTKGIDYEAQFQTRDSEGAAQRPDFVIHLPGGGKFVVDSKVALTAFLDAVDAPDEATRKDALRRHAAQVKTHVKQLARKDYAANVVGAIDFVALFIPGESFYSAAIEEDPDLFDEAIKANVIITTPATLLALAKAVAYGFKQEKIEQNAVKIAQIGSKLHDRIATFAKHMGTLGSGLKTATNNYNKAVASFEGRVLPSLREIDELNGQTKQIEGPEQIDEVPRLMDQSD